VADVALENLVWLFITGVCVAIQLWQAGGHYIFHHCDILVVLCVVAFKSCG
jgi:hypothetical protein